MHAGRIAERAFNFERGFERGCGMQRFLPGDNCDTLHEQLLAGERLQFALRRMEKAYFDANCQGDAELTKHISLRLAFPIEFLKLMLTGCCEVYLPEWLFDLDYPGQYAAHSQRLADHTLRGRAVCGGALPSDPAEQHDPLRPSPGWPARPLLRTPPSSPARASRRGAAIFGDGAEEPRYGDDHRHHPDSRAEFCPGCDGVYEPECDDPRFLRAYAAMPRRSRPPAGRTMPGCSNSIFATSAYLRFRVLGPPSAAGESAGAAGGEQPVRPRFAGRCRDASELYLTRRRRHAAAGRPGGGAAPAAGQRPAAVRRAARHARGHGTSCATTGFPTTGTPTGPPAIATCRSILGASDFPSFSAAMIWRSTTWSCSSNWPTRTDGTATSCAISAAKRSTRRTMPTSRGVDVLCVADEDLARTLSRQPQVAGGMHAGPPLPRACFGRAAVWPGSARGSGEDISGTAPTPIGSWRGPEGQRIHGARNDMARIDRAASGEGPAICAPQAEMMCAESQFYPRLIPDGAYDCRQNRKAIFNRGMVPNINANPRGRKFAKRGRKPIVRC